MIYPDVTVEEWCKKLDIELRAFKCGHCQKENLIDVPFISRDFIGFEKRKCDHCGGKISAASALLNSKQEKLKWGLA